VTLTTQLLGDQNLIELIDRTDPARGSRTLPGAGARNQTRVEKGDEGRRGGSLPRIKGIFSLDAKACQSTCVWTPWSGPIGDPFLPTHGKSLAFLCHRDLAHHG
jgi:hypothetical protein